MRHLLLTFIMILVSFNHNNESKSPSESVVVLELFTSQGCSSCPAADELLKEVRDRSQDNKVLTLSYHVDYWNYIGWHDPFSSKSYADKQREYASKFYSRSIYTPQLVINGKEHLVGSDKTKLTKKLDHYLNKALENSIKLDNVVNNEGVVTFDYSTVGSTSKKWLNVTLVIKDRITKVKRGENKNSTLTNANIVVNQVTVDLETNGRGSINIPDIVESCDDIVLMVFAQNSNLEITGGAQVTL